MGMLCRMIIVVFSCYICLFVKCFVGLVACLLDESCELRALRELPGVDDVVAT